MQRSRWWVFGLIIVLSSWACSLADDQDQVKKIVAQAIQAKGGEKNLAKWNAATWKAKGTFYGFGDGVPYTGDWWVQGRDQFKMDIANTFVLVLNGKQGWVVEGGNPRDMTAEELTEQKESMYSSWLEQHLPLSQSGFTLALAGETKVGDRPATGIKVSHAGHRDVTLYFDNDNHLLVKAALIVKAADQGGKELPQEAFFSDYKDISGVKMPMKEVIKRDGKKYLEGETTDVKLLEKLDDKTFSKP